MDSIPLQSILPREQYDYVDVFTEEFEDPESKITPLQAAKFFFLGTPSWVRGLMRLRNWIVGILGLKTGDEEEIGDPEAYLAKLEGKVGERIALFRVYKHEENELIMGEDDSHLDFRVSVLLSEPKNSRREIALTTTVQYNNWFGRLYFFFVKPFHRIIAKRLLKSIIHQIEKTH